MGDHLRPVTAADSDQLLGWRNTPEVRGFVFHQRVIAPQDHAAWFAKMLVDDHSAFFVFERDGQPSGVVGFTGISLAKSQADWGFYTTPNAPKGSGTAMLRLALDHAFQTVGLNTICAEVLAYNHASLHIHNKLGFERIGLRSEGHCVDDIFHEVVVFAKTAPTDL